MHYTPLYATHNLPRVISFLILFKNDSDLVSYRIIDASMIQENLNGLEPDRNCARLGSPILPSRERLFARDCSESYLRTKGFFGRFGESSWSQESGASLALDWKPKKHPCAQRTTEPSKSALRDPPYETLVSKSMANFRNPLNGWNMPMHTQPSICPA
jgi:hypothetical protein